MSLSPVLFANLCLLLFLLTELVLRKGRAARSMSEGATDHGTSRQILYTYLLCVALLLLSAPMRAHLLAEGWRWAGVALAAFGLVFRWWAMVTLGQFYTRTLRTIDGHSIVDSGPYRWIRHPGYLGSLLTWLGASAALAPPVVGAIIFLALLMTYWRRITHEERMLVQSLGASYEDYQGRSWRLLPPLF